ncbi:MAG: hypothetical protein AAGI07_16635, partial [Bacteroidota bacterium]
INSHTQNDIASIKSILKVLDDNDANIDIKLSVWVDDLIHMAPNNVAITNKADLSNYLQEQNSYGYSDMKHEIIEVSSYDDIVLMQGKVIGTFHPKDNGNQVAFETKNLFVFRRLSDGSLKIWKIIYNMSPNF